MNRPMINETLFNTENYDVLREQMVTDLTADELDQPAHILRDLLEDYIARMFADMEDDVLQDHYDALMERDPETAPSLREDE